MKMSQWGVNFSRMFCQFGNNNTGLFAKKKTIWDKQRAIPPLEQITSQKQCPNHSKRKTIRFKQKKAHTLLHGPHLL